MCFVEAVKVNLPARLGDNKPESEALYTSVVPGIRVQHCSCIENFIVFEVNISCSHTINLRVAFGVTEGNRTPSWLFH